MMMRRSSRFWHWADCELHCRSHDEVFWDGNVIDVQTRVSSKGQTQLFIGIYDKSGWPVFEETHDNLPNDTMTTALEWGVGRARAIAASLIVIGAHVLANRSSSTDSRRSSAS